MLVGSQETSNYLNDQFPDQYEHISMAHHMSVPTLDLLAMVDGLETSESSGDLTDALLVRLYRPV